MRPQTYWVELSEQDRIRLLLLIRQGTAPARVVRRAHTLLQASEGEGRNAAGATVTWRFTTAHARTRLARLYPALHE